MKLAEQGKLPDAAIRLGIRRLLRRRLEQSVPGDCEQRAQVLEQLVAAMDSGPVAVHTVEANAQHYEVPSAFFERVMGQHLKYSCCLFPRRTDTLTQAEEAMLGRTTARAQIENGQSVLELGCGWGSLSLWLAERYPQARITAVSNSRTQKAFIDQRAASRGIDNLEVVTADMNSFDVDQTFDRVVSVEMFEHMRNWRELMSRIGRWLKPGGKLFVHVFCHHSTPYLFSDSGEDDWMARHFFTGGMMPSADLALRFQDDLRIERYAAVSGMHYARTCERWLANVDRDPARVLDALGADGSGDAAATRLQRWRIFFMACAELFAFNGGNEWHVAHYRFERP